MAQPLYNPFLTAYTLNIKGERLAEKRLQL